MAKAKKKQADFGFHRVPLGDKQALVDDVFHSVARRYDLMNDLMSGGLHRAWKAALVTAVNPPRKGRPGRLHEKGGTPFALLDLAGGTGDVAFRVADAGGPGTHVTVAAWHRQKARVTAGTRKPKPARIRSATCRRSTLPPPNTWTSWPGCWTPR